MGKPKTNLTHIQPHVQLVRQSEAHTKPGGGDKTLLMVSNTVASQKPEEKYIGNLVTFMSMVNMMIYIYLPLYHFL